MCRGGQERMREGGTVRGPQERLDPGCPGLGPTCRAVKGSFLVDRSGQCLDPTLPHSLLIQWLRGGFFDGGFEVGGFEITLPL